MYNLGAEAQGRQCDCGGRLAVNELASAVDLSELVPSAVVLAAKPKELFHSRSTHNSRRNIRTLENTKAPVRTAVMKPVVNEYGLYSLNFDYCELRG